MIEVVIISITGIICVSGFICFSAVKEDLARRVKNIIEGEM